MEALTQMRIFTRIWYKTLESRCVPNKFAEIAVKVVVGGATSGRWLVVGEMFALDLAQSKKEQILNTSTKWALLPSLDL